VGAICTFPFSSIELHALGVAVGAPAYPETILTAEELLIKMAAEKGYPHFRIIERHVIADQHEKNLSVTLDVDSGPLTTFGCTSITGNSSVDEDFIRNKIAWQEGADYSLEDIVKTRRALERTGLFSSTSITYRESEEGQTEMPMEIELIEAKHRTVAAGLGYNTQRGVGGTAEWEHRNIRGKGERVNVQASYWSDAQRLKGYYVLPDFGKVDQSLLWQASLEHEKTKGYSDSSLGLSGQIDSKINSELRVAYGLAYKSIFTTNSDNNRNFNLLKVPLHIRWSNANSLLDPTMGGTVNLKIAPTVQIFRPQFGYCPTNLTTTYYQPFTEDQRFVLATKFSIGSIFGSKLERIPPSERLYAGGDNNLRGYRYQTVSPLDKDNKPIGGRSLMILSLEGRVRINETFGIVAFYEAGNVYKSSFPQLGHKQLQTVGAGLRYHTPVGPIRFDVAVPLNPRKGLDSNYQIYMSIGQSF
jgi:translocation and assembly module TamA